MKMGSRHVVKEKGQLREGRPLTPPTQAILEDIKALTVNAVMPSFPDDRLTKPERIETPTTHTHRDIHPGSHTLPHSHTQALTHTHTSLLGSLLFLHFWGLVLSFIAAHYYYTTYVFVPGGCCCCSCSPFVVSRKPQQQQQHDWRLLKKSILVTSPSLSLLLSLSCCRVPVVPTGNPWYDPATATSASAYMLSAALCQSFTFKRHVLLINPTHNYTERKRREVGEETERERQAWLQLK